MVHKASNPPSSTFESSSKESSGIVQTIKLDKNEEIIDSTRFGFERGASEYDTEKEFDVDDLKKKTRVEKDVQVFMDEGSSTVEIVNTLCCKKIIKKENLNFKNSNGKFSSKKNEKNGEIYVEERVLLIKSTVVDMKCTKKRREIMLELIKQFKDGPFYVEPKRYEIKNELEEPEAKVERLKLDSIQQTWLLNKLEIVSNEAKII